MTTSILLFVPSPSHGLISLVPWEPTASVADLETAAVNSPRILSYVGGDTGRALIGEIIAEIARARGGGGVVIDGAVRDAAALAASPFPVFVRVAMHRGPYKNGPGEIDVPVSSAKRPDPKGVQRWRWLAGWKQDSLMVRHGATFDHQSDEVLCVAWIEHPIHNGPQATVLGDMALQRCWHARIKDLVAHRRKEAAEVGQIKGVLRIFDLPAGRPAVEMDRHVTHSTSPEELRSRCATAWAP